MITKIPSGAKIKGSAIPKATTDQQRDAKARQTAIQRAITDPKFRASFIKNPKKVLGELRGKKLDTRMTVVVHEDTDTIRNIVIPFTGVEIEELSDKELDTLTLRNSALQVCIPIG
jgi:hypothetical protein